MNCWTFPRLGIIGGGQLGRMLALAASQWGVSVTILDPQPNSPAGQVSGHQIVANYDDLSAIQELNRRCDIVTIEIEHVPIDALDALTIPIYPSRNTIAVIQKKDVQKQVLSSAGIPISPWAYVTDSGKSPLGTPVIWKAIGGGYDGYGVKRIVEDSVLDPGIVEKIIDIDKEIGIMVARSVSGEVSVYPVVEMTFCPDRHICTRITAPATVSPKIETRITALAVDAIRAINGIGIFGVECFLTPSGEIIVNEIAPRPHNSGHYTIEAVPTSQFFQLLRAIFGLPLGPITPLTPAVMVNILGRDDAKSLSHIRDLVMTVPNAHLHLYGKSPRPGRKLGHITITGNDIDPIRIADTIESLTTPNRP